MFPSFTTMTSRPGGDLTGLLKAFSCEADGTELGPSVDVLGVAGSLSSVAGVTAGYRLAIGWPTSASEVTWAKIGTELYSLVAVGGSLVSRGRRCALVLWYSLPFISIMYVLSSLSGLGRLKTLPGSQICFSEFHTYTGSEMLRARLSCPAFLL